MVTVTHFSGGGGFTVKGHAGDHIACAGISTLVQTFVESAETLTDANVISYLSPGMAIVAYWNPSEQLRLLVDSFFTGVRGVEGAYPERIAVRDDPRQLVAFHLVDAKKIRMEECAYES